MRQHDFRVAARWGGDALPLDHRGELCGGCRGGQQCDTRREQDHSLHRPTVFIRRPRRRENGHSWRPDARMVIDAAENPLTKAPDAPLVVRTCERMASRGHLRRGLRIPPRHASGRTASVSYAQVESPKQVEERLLQEVRRCARGGLVGVDCAPSIPRGGRGCHRIAGPPFKEQAARAG